MDSCSLFLLLSTFFEGYDLYIIALISPWSRSEARKRTKCAGVPSSFKYHSMQQGVRWKHFPSDWCLGWHVQQVHESDWTLGQLWRNVGKESCKEPKIVRFMFLFYPGRTWPIREASIKENYHQSPSCVCCLLWHWKPIRHPPPPPIQQHSNFAA